MEFSLVKKNVPDKHYVVSRVMRGTIRYMEKNICAFVDEYEARMFMNDCDKGLINKNRIKSLERSYNKDARYSYNGCTWELSKIN